MKVVKCENNHFFDEDEYQKCPECGAMAKQTTADEIKIKPKKSIFDLFKNKESKEETTTISTNNTFSQRFAQIQEEKERNKLEKSEVSQSRDGKTHGFFDPFEKREERTQLEILIEEKDFFEKEYDIKENVTEKNTSEKPSLAESLKKVSASDDGKTMGYFESRKKEEEHVERVTTDPVVGWLVAVKGPLLGRSYSIYSGNNSVGRNDANTIILAGDQSVSRKSHTHILYEPRKELFFVKAGDERGIVYINDEPLVSGAIEVKYKDIISVGNSSFILVPLCGKDFSWEEYIEKA